MSRKPIAAGGGRSAQRVYREALTHIVRGRATALIETTQVTGNRVIPVSTLDESGIPLNTTVSVPIHRVLSAEYEDPTE
jgi:hypothetical protein